MEGKVYSDGTSKDICSDCGHYGYGGGGAGGSVWIVSTSGYVTGGGRIEANGKWQI